MLLDVARGFVRDQAPIEAVRAQLETDTGYDAAIWQAMVDMGWAGIALPDTVGGAGMGVGSAVPVFEALGGGLVGTPLLSTTLALGFLLCSRRTLKACGHEARMF